MHAVDDFQRRRSVSCLCWRWMERRYVRVRPLLASSLASSVSSGTQRMKFERSRCLAFARGSAVAEKPRDDATFCIIYNAFSIVESSPRGKFQDFIGNWNWHEETVVLKQFQSLSSRAEISALFWSRNDFFFVFTWNTLNTAILFGVLLLS